MTTTPLHIANITKRFSDHPVLEDISLEVAAQQMFGLIGLNGIGKTTLIKAILDLLAPDAGDIRIFGVPHYQPASRSRLAYLPEKFTPSPFLIGNEFLSLSQQSFCRPFDPIKAKRLAEALDLDPAALLQPIRKYSKGMGQKLGLVAIFLSEAPLLLLDEPMSGLDPKARICLKALLRDYVKNGGTVFFSSHILADIDEICSHVGIIHQSKMVFTGTPASFKQQFPGKTLEEAFLEAILHV
jgi:ABC-2 type transport system ATP-binding protein